MQDPSSEEQIRSEADARLAAIVESSDDAIVSKTLEGIVTSWNKGAQRIFGWASEEMVGQSITKIIPANLLHEEPHILERLRRGERIDPFETIRKRKDGRLINVSVTVSPVRNREGRIIGASKIARDITAEVRLHRELKEAKEAAELKERQLFDFMENATVGLTWIGADGIVRWANKRELQMLGYERTEYVGQHVANFHADRKVIDELLSRVFGGETLIDFPARLRCKNGSIRQVLINGSVRLDPGNSKSAECFTRDVTALKAAEQERNQLFERERTVRIEAERSSRMKDEFLATLSHELRTPLNAILGYAQLMRGGMTDSAELAEAIEVIERNARAQTRIIEDLLDMSRIISGKIRLDVQPVDLAAVVTAAIETVKPSAELKHIKLTGVLDPLVGPIKGDPARLQQVVWNLLTNAIKFTPRGGRVQVALERVNSQIEILVSDTGEGIKPEFLPHVFDRFRQADASTTRHHGGLGIGLSIVKQLVELHGGDSARPRVPASAGRDVHRRSSGQHRARRRSHRRPRPSDRAVDEAFGTVRRNRSVRRAHSGRR